MNCGELKQILLRRFEADGNAAAMHYEDAPLALNLGHRQIQLDLNLRCMEARTVDLTYPAGDTAGIAAADDYKSIRAVYRRGADGTLSSPIQPATSLEIENLIGAKVEQSDGRLSATDFQIRWFEREMGLVLAPPPSTDLTLVVDYYKFLPAYSAADDSDYISERLTYPLICASAWLWLNIFAPPNGGEAYRGMYELELQKQALLDRQAKQGPNYQVRRPPLPGTRR